MPSESFKFALYDIRDNILLAQRFVDGLTFDGFKDSRLHVYATTRALDIISEASRRLPDNFRDRHQHLPWCSIRDAGNFYRHQYDNVIESYVWETVHTHLAPLLTVILAEIRALEGEP
jgi:uncharacterized protein with HEPN domain